MGGNEGKMTTRMSWRKKPENEEDKEDNEEETEMTSGKRAPQCSFLKHKNSIFIT